MNEGALGLIEVQGYLSAIEAADTALKAADVTLIGCEKIRGGIVTVKIEGDVAAVKSAVDAAKEAAKKFTSFISAHVISRPDTSVWSILKNKQTKEEIDEEKVNAEKINNEEKIEEEKEHLETDLENVQTKLAKEELEKKTVEELRRLVRSLSIAMTNKQIKFARKDKLIFEILNFYQRGGINNGNG